MSDSIAIHDLYSKADLFIRSSIITFTAGTFAYIYGCNPFAQTQATPTQIKTVCALAPILIGVLWIFEMGYFKKFNQNIIIARANHPLTQQPPGTQSFFLIYKPFTHRWFYFIYPIVIAYLWWHSEGKFWPTIITWLLVGLAVFEMGCIATMWVDDPTLSFWNRLLRLSWAIPLLILLGLPRKLLKA